MDTGKSPNCIESRHSCSPLVTEDYWTRSDRADQLLSCFYCDCPCHRGKPILREIAALLRLAEEG